ncbi:hypothetical protein HDU97_007694 [Phlyctochytrium planicorne]|nr:hypothetical protein HDU97_007694 [Phlyctochytrium planicorne]
MPPSELLTTWQPWQTVRTYALPVIGLALWALMTVISISALIIINLRYNTKKPTPKSSSLPYEQAPGVSILRPLKGVDINLKENLASTFRLNYPKFEVLFSVASDQDPAIQVVKDLKEEYPHVDATMIIGDVSVGVNPKINNMIRSYEASKYEIIWILDSNVIVYPDSLGRSVDLLMLPRVGLVHHLPVATNPVGFGSYLEAAFLNTVHAKMYIVINKVAVASCIVGKSNLFRKKSLNPVGGLLKFGRFMSEDNIIGNTIWNQRLRHMMTNDVASQPLGKVSMEDYFLRRARWTRIRKYTVVGATLFEPFSESIINGLLSANALNFFFGVPPVPYFIVHMLLWFITDYIIAAIVSPGNTDNFLYFTAAWLLREVSALPVYLYACAGSTVEWRGALFRLKNDGTVEQAPDALQMESTKAKLNGSNATNGNLRDEAFAHPLVTYLRSIRLLAFGIMASVLFGIAYVTDMLSFIFFLGNRGRLGLIPPKSEDELPAEDSSGRSNVVHDSGAEADRTPSVVKAEPEDGALYKHVAGFITGRTYAGRAVSLSDVWHSMFVKIGLASSFKEDDGVSPTQTPAALRKNSGTFQEDSGLSKKKRSTRKTPKDE